MLLMDSEGSSPSYLDPFPWAEHHSGRTTLTRKLYFLFHTGINKTDWARDKAPAICFKAAPSAPFLGLIS